MQSVIVGWYARKRMLALDRSTTTGFTSNPQPVPEDDSGKRYAANFFALHYGAFHVAYLMFLAGMPAVGSWRDGFVLLACGVSFG